MPIISSSDYGAPGDGLVNARRPHLVYPGKFAVLQNCDFRSGAIVRRGGTVQQGDAPTSATVRWIFHAYGDDASAALRVKMRLCGTVLSYGIGALSSWTSFETGLTAGTFPVAVTYKDQVWWCDGTNTARKISIANPPVDSGWGGLPSGINPRWVVLHKNRLYYGGDITTPTYVYMTDPGTPETTQTTNFYQIPDSQQGFSPRIALDMGEGIGFFAQDIKCFMTGTGPLSHRIYQFSPAEAAIYWRTCVSIEDVAYYMTEKGPYKWDGHQHAVPVDPFGEINWGLIDFTTIEDTWAMRDGDLWIIYFKFKGNVTTAATGTAWQRFSAVYNLRTRLSISSADAQTGHFLVYDTRLRRFVGPSVGNHLCGAMETAQYGDTQDRWLGDATTGGKVFKGNQVSAFTDDSAGFPMIIRTGALSDQFTEVNVDWIKIHMKTLKAPGACARVELFFDNRVEGKADAEWSIPLNQADAPQDGMGDLARFEWRGDSVTAYLKPNFEVVERMSGRMPALEITCNNTEGDEFYGYAVKLTPVEEA